MTKFHNPITVTIDGPAGAGKSTVAKALAARVGFSYLDTGAMYRALTLKALRAGVDLASEAALLEIAHATTIELEPGDNGVRVLLDGEDVSEAIRTPEVTNQTFYIARAPRIRAVMVGWQQDIGRRQDVVVEGRDAGTVIFPDARYKFYLDADVDERSRRRLEEFRGKGESVDPAELKKDLQERDHKDFSRAVGPLKKADDAMVIDSTRLTVEEVVGEMMKQIMSEKREKGKGKRG